MSKDKLSESDMQEEIKQHLVSREVDVVEGAEFGGGETDLLLYQQLVVENKVMSTRTSDPFGAGKKFSWQARRYSNALCKNVVFVVVAYRPGTEADMLPLPDRIKILELEGASEERCEVRFAIPWGMGVPSSARSPTSRRDRK